MNTETHTPDSTAPLTLEGIDAYFFRCEHCNRDNELFMLSGEDKFICVRCEKKSAMNRPIDREHAGRFSFNQRSGAEFGLPFSPRQRMPITFEMAETLRGTTERTFSDIDRAYTVSITNTIPVATEVTLFGANRFLTSVNFGMNATIQISVGETTYQELLLESMTRPLNISGFRVIANSSAQLEQVLVTKNGDANGNSASNLIRLTDWSSVFSFMNSAEVFPYNLTIDGFTEISFTLLPSATVSLTLFVN